MSFQLANFGDRLNDWIFPRLSPDGFFDRETDVCILGIGTILGLREPPPGTKHTLVFSSGWTPGIGKRFALDTYDVRCVRGPETANALGLHMGRAKGDGAYMLRLLFPYREYEKRHRFSFMPHVHSVTFWHYDWETICCKCGVNFVSPVWSTERILREIASTEVMLCEAMHAAIVADAFRVPWVPCLGTRGIPGFKWIDFCSSIGLGYKPNRFPPLIHTVEISRNVRKLLGETTAPMVTRVAKHALGHIHGRLVRHKIIDALRRMKLCRTILSDSSKVCRTTEELEREWNQIVQEFR